MGKNDLLSEDDFFTLNDEKVVPSDKPGPEKTAEDNLFKDVEFDRPNPPQTESAPEIIIDAQDDKPIPISTPPKQAPPTPTPPPAPAPKKPAGKIKEPYRYDFEEDVHDKVNYKPVVIGFIVVALLVGGYFAWNYFKEKEPVVVEEAPQGPSPEEIARTNFYSALSGKTHYHNSQISKILSMTTGKNRISSLMLYGNDFVFEIFSKDRADLARYLRNLQNQFGANRITLNTTTDRPGSNGGVFGQFDLLLDKSGSNEAEVTEPLEAVDDIKNWLNSLAGKNNLQIGEFSTSAIASMDIYRGAQAEASYKGTVGDLSEFINQFATSNKNIIIYKLSLTSTDLKNYSSKKYQLKLILKAYM